MKLLLKENTHTERCRERENEYEWQREKKIGWKSQGRRTQLFFIIQFLSV